MEVKSDVFCGDAAKILQNIEENTVDLIMEMTPWKASYL
jgi:DNA modification methylase